MGVGDLQESNHRGPPLRRDPATFTLWKMIYYMQCKLGGV